MDSFDHRRLRLWLRLQTLIAATSNTAVLSAKLEAITTGDAAPAYLRHINFLNSLVANVGKSVDAVPDDHLPHHNRNPLYALRSAGTFLGVGFDAGRSVLMAPTMFPHLKYLGVDDYRHAYTVACGDYLSVMFGPPFKFLKGKSHNILPWLVAQNPDPTPDLIHIVTGPDTENFRQGLSNVLTITR